MQTWRDLGKFAFVAVVFGICFAMLVAAIGPRSPWLGLLLMFYFMGLARLAEPLVRLRMPRRVRVVETDRGGVASHRWPGVERFGDLLRRTPLRRLNDSVYRASGRHSLAALSRQAESAEAIHFWAAVLFTPYIAYVGYRGFRIEVVLFVLVQIVCNMYPILHLRLVRARLDRIRRNAATRRQERRSTRR